MISVTPFALLSSPLLFSLRTPVDLMASPIPQPPLDHFRAKPPPPAAPSPAVVTPDAAEDIRATIISTSTHASLHTASGRSSLVLTSDELDGMDSELMTMKYAPPVLRYSHEPRLERATYIGGATVGVGGADGGDASAITHTGASAPPAPNPSSHNSPNTISSPTPGLDAAGDALAGGFQVSKLAKLQRCVVEYGRARTCLTVQPQLHADRDLDCEYDSEKEDGSILTKLMTDRRTLCCKHGRFPSSASK